MTINKGIFAGADVGASRTKVALLDNNKELIGYCVRRSGTDFSQTSDDCLDDALGNTDYNRDDITFTVSTGYGRRNVA